MFKTNLRKFAKSNFRKFATLKKNIKIISQFGHSDLCRYVYEIFLSVAPDAVAYCHKSRRWEGGHRQVGRQKATTEYVF